MTPTIRRYTPQDCAACWQVFHRAVQIGAARFYDQAQRDAWCATAPEPNRANCARLADVVTYVASTDDHVVGFMSLEPDGHLDMAFVDPDHMGQGIAAALYAHILQSANTAGLKHLTTEASHLARRFFLRQDWQVVRPETVDRGGVSLPRFVMQLTLKD